MAVVRDVSGIVARTGRSSGLDALLAAGLTIAGELEVLLSPPAASGRLASALVLPLTTVPLAWRRRAPLLPLAAVAAGLVTQTLLGALVAEPAVTSLVALVLALYAAGRYVAGAAGLAVAVTTTVALAAMRIAFDPAVETAGDAILTLAYAPVPLLVGRWLRGQALLRAELEGKADELERERERNALQAADEERMRIAADLRAVVSGSLTAILRDAEALPGRLGAHEGAAARALFAGIAGRAREALADVRRILGVLRHGSPAPLGPGAPPEATAAERAAAPPTAPATAPAAVPPPQRTARRARRHDLALVAALLAGAELELAFAAPAGDLPLAAVSAVLIVAPLMWRRRAPVAVALAVLAAVALQSAVLRLDAFPVADSFALISASYAVGAHAGRRAAVAGLAALVAGLAAHAAVFHPDGVAPAVLGAGLVPWVAGRTLRSRRLLARELGERAARMEHAREQEALAARTAERVRVARELHDAVAHSISVIAIQAAGADGLVDRDGERAAQVAALLATVSRDALAELGRLVAPAAAETAAQPGLAGVDALAQRARAGGMEVDVRVEGEPAEVPSGVDLAAYRIVQEALANTAKHARAGHAWVVVRYDRRAVEVEVADDGRGPNGARPAGAGGGHGLVGIRERVALYDGTLDVGRRPSGGFLVHARLPTTAA